VDVFFWRSSAVTFEYTMSDQSKQHMYSDAEKEKIRNEILEALKEESTESKIAEHKEVKEIVKNVVAGKKDASLQANQKALAVKMEERAYSHTLKTAAKKAAAGVVVKKKRFGNVSRGIHVELTHKPKNLLLFRMMSIIFAVALVVFFIIFIIFGNLVAQYGTLWQGK